jgi:predicted nuclease of predicted toxin-antitoxin system
MKLLLDMNLSPRWVTFFLEAGYETIRWSAVGPENASDKDIMSYARTHGFAVFTHDQDFNTLLSHSKEGKPSVILLRTSSLRIEKVGQRVLQAITAAAHDLISGAILVIDDNRVRVRNLPLA